MLIVLHKKLINLNYVLAGQTNDIGKYNLLNYLLLILDIYIIRYIFEFFIIYLYWTSHILLIFDYLYIYIYIYK